jgi:hypothetical protein
MDLLVLAFAKLQPGGALGVCGFAKVFTGRPDTVVDGDIVDAFVDLTKQRLILGHSRSRSSIYRSNGNPPARTRRFPNRVCVVANGYARNRRVRRRQCSESRSMVMILHATCQQTLSALAAAKIDTALTDDVHRMIEATNTELAALEQKIDGPRVPAGDG